MALCAPFRTSRETCYALKDAGMPYVGRLTPRPWNIYEPNTTRWWLVPTTEWPAYRHGKVLCSGNAGGSPPSIQVGLYVEKGLHPSVVSAYPCRKGSRLILREDWVWHRFVADLETGNTLRLITELARRLPVPITFAIDGGYIDDPCDSDVNRARSGLTWARYTFEWDEGGRLTLREGEPRPEGPFEALAHLRGYEDVSPVLHELASNPWLWVDVFLGIGFQSSPDDGGSCWGAEDFWTHFLRHLTAWLA